MHEAAKLIQTSCQGLLSWLEELRASAPGTDMKHVVQNAVLEMETTEWLTPPMLQTRR